MRATTALLLCALGAAVAAPSFAQTAPMPWQNVQWHDPATAASAAGLNAITTSLDDGWLAYAVPNLPGTGTLCCFAGFPRDPLTPGCALDRESNIYGNSDALPDSQRLIVLAHIEQGNVDQLRAVGERCPIDAAGEKVTWLPAIDPQHSLQWLAQLARTNAATSNNNFDLGERAVTALAHHDHPRTVGLLQTLAQELPADMAGNAVHGLGISASDDRLQALRELLQRLPNGEVRQDVSFALAHQDSESAWQLLRDLARNDKDEAQREASIAALNDNPTDATVTLLTDIMNTDTSRHLRSLSLHILGELEHPQALATVWQAAREHNDERLRGEAWYILAEHDSGQALPELLTVLQQPQPDTVVEFALAGISESEHPQAIPHLIRLTANEYPESVRRSALIWLAESENPQAVNALLRALER